MQTLTTSHGTPAAAGIRQFATFVLDGLLFGVDVLTVQEVIRHQAMTRVPCAPPVVEG
ncbi:MAG: chemotaxis protein CheW [Vicinamibacterales bacterium]